MLAINRGHGEKSNRQSRRSQHVGHSIQPSNLPVSLYTQLQAVRSEEDVKDAYIKALGLKGYTKGLIDIQTNEIWFEAKDTGKCSTYAMFTQLLHYVQVALNKGEKVPPFLAVIDTEKAALMKSADVLPFLAKKTIKWGKSASQYTQEALDEISAHIGTHFVSFKISTHEDEFISSVKVAILSGDIIRTQITPDNLKQVFDKWVAMVGREINGVAEEDYALLFFADIMHDGTVSTHANLPAQHLHEYAGSGRHRRDEGHQNLRGRAALSVRLFERRHHG